MGSREPTPGRLWPGCWPQLQLGERDTGNRRQHQKLLAAADGVKAPQEMAGSHSLVKGELCEKWPNCTGSSWGYSGESEPCKASGALVVLSAEII